MADFVVLKQLGKGSYGTVLQVRHASDGEIFALKKVDISKMSRREIADSLGEVRFLASVHHSNIIRFVDAFLTREGDTLCTVMEFADGGDLASKVERHRARGAPLPEDVIFAYFLQMADAIAHLHRLKVLHRDLKTANIFLTAQGQVKVGDLGVSRLAKGGLARTQIEKLQPRLDAWLRANPAAAAASRVPFPARTTFFPSMTSDRAAPKRARLARIATLLRSSRKLTSLRGNSGVITMIATIAPTIAGSARESQCTTRSWKPPGTA